MNLETLWILGELVWNGPWIKHYIIHIKKKPKKKNQNTSSMNILH